MSNLNPIEYNGIIYNSKRALAEAYGMDGNLFCKRLRKGMTIEEALTTPKSKTDISNPVTDPNGRVFTNDREMVDYWHNVLGYEITYSVYKHRAKIRPDKMLENLTRPISTGRLEMVYDHCGNAFVTLKKMLEYWDITISVWNTRKKWGWDLEKILTTPMPVHAIESIDHLGNKFESRQKMLEYWGITRRMWEQRTRYGWSLKDKLTLPKHSCLNKKTRGRNKPCKDHLGNEFCNLTDMADYWGVSVNKLQGKSVNLTDMKSLQKKLEIIPTSRGEQVICYTLKANGMKFVFNMGFTCLARRFSNIDFDKIDEKLRDKSIEFKYYSKREKYCRLRPDFCLFDNDKVLAIIEYNGSQHYNRKNFAQSIRAFEKKCEGDKFKKFASNAMGVPFFVIDEKRKDNDCDEEYVISELKKVIAEIMDDCE